MALHYTPTCTWDTHYIITLHYTPTCRCIYGTHYLHVSGTLHYTPMWVVWVPHVHHMVTSTVSHLYTCFSASLFYLCVVPQER